MLIETDLAELLSRLELPSAAREVLLERFEQSMELVRFGEPCIAMENLCDNLYEFAVPLTGEVRDRLAGWCRGSRVGSDRVSLLDALVVPLPGAG